MTVRARDKEQACWGVKLGFGQQHQLSEMEDAGEMMCFGLRMCVVHVGDARLTSCAFVSWRSRRVVE
jgi:hypothetical protein